MVRKNHFFRRCYRRRYDVATETSLYGRLQDVVNQMTSTLR